MVKSGMNATRMIKVAKRTGLDALLAPSMMRSRLFSSSVRAGELAIDALQHDDGGIDENAKIDGADGDQIGRLPGSTIMEKAKSTANGMVIAARKLMRKSPSMKINTRVTRTRPVKTTWRTVSVVVLIRLVRS